MNFDNSTLTNLMSLIDEHKDDFKEVEYLQMCNVMKHLYLNQSEREHTPRTTQRPEQIFTNAMAASVVMDSIRKIQRKLNSNGRVINIDKLKVLSELFTVNSLTTQGINARTDTEMVHEMTSRLVHIVPLRTIIALMKEAKEKRIEYDRSLLQAQIIEQEAKLVQLNMYPPEDPFRPENIRL